MPSQKGVNKRIRMIQDHAGACRMLGGRALTVPRVDPADFENCAPREAAAMAMSCNHWIDRFQAAYFLSDPQLHRQAKMLMRDHQTGDRAAGHEAAIRNVLNALVERAPVGEPFGFGETVAQPFGYAVTTHLLGVDLPPQTLADFEHGGRAIILAHSSGAEKLAWWRALRPLILAVERIVAEKTYRDDGLLARLTELGRQTGAGADFAVMSAAMVLLTGGTVRDALRLSVHAVLTDPELSDMARRDPSRVAEAVDEFLRLHPPKRRLVRCVAEESSSHERLYEISDIEKANRDPDRFPAPDRFNADRRPNRHLSFGFGMSICDGAPISRVVLRLALHITLTRMRNLRQADEAGRVIFDALDP